MPATSKTMVRGPLTFVIPYRREPGSGSHQPDIHPRSSWHALPADGNDESRHTTERAINFVKQRTDNVIVIDYAEISQGLHPWLAPFLMFVPMEWLCYYLSIYKDHNPDERRYYGGLVEY